MKYIVRAIPSASLITGGKCYPALVEQDIILEEEAYNAFKKGGFLNKEISKKPYGVENKVESSANPFVEAVEKKRGRPSTKL